jgi:hypothetical protein
MYTFKQNSGSSVAFPTGTSAKKANAFELRSSAQLNEALAHLHTHMCEAFEIDKIEDVGEAYRIPVKGFAFTHILAEWQDESEDWFVTLVYTEGRMESHVYLEEYKWNVAINSLNLPIFA